MSIFIRGTLAKLGDHRIGYSFPLLGKIGCGCLPTVLVIVVIAVFAASVPSCSEEPDDRSMPAVTETEELHNPYDDYDFNVCSKIKYIKNGCYGYEIADEDSAHPVTYKTGESVFVASYSPTLGWSRIQAGNNFYYVKSKNLTTTDPATVTEPPKSSLTDAQPPVRQQEPVKSQEPVNQQEPTKQIASEPSLGIISYTKSIEAGSKGSVTIKGTPGVEYNINVHVSTKVSEAKGLENQIADTNGYVTWTWKVSPSTKPGDYWIDIFPAGNSSDKISIDYSIYD